MRLKKMGRKHYLRLACRLLLASLPLLLAGCSSALMDPKGQVGEDQRVLIITAFVLMLIVVIPVIVMTLLFAFRYRAGNQDAAYRPDWAHSKAIEVVVWLIPCVIIVVLAILTWITSHSLDPKKPIDTGDDQSALEIQVVSLDWKWLFIYPEQGVASVNEVAFPANTPIHFRISSGSVMNSFWIPELGTQIYAMAGMDSDLNLIANEQGTYPGRSTNFSGAGFAGMTFNALALSGPGFKKWLAKARASDTTLSFPSGYERLARPSQSVPVQYYSHVPPNLYQSILNSFRKSVAEKSGTTEHSGHTGAEAAE
jgi:cytochrome o ubiquinol oxidase subunit 2